jgi:hypothetical protein
MFRSRTYLRRELQLFNPSPGRYRGRSCSGLRSLFSPVDLTDGPSPPGHWFNTAKPSEAKEEFFKLSRDYVTSLTIS